MTDAAQSLQEQAYHALLQRIIYSEYRPGMKLVLKEVSEDLEMGRTPIRESLVRLGQQDIVYTVPQSGTFVSKIDMNAAEQARFMREQLERTVAVECCVRAGKADLALLAADIEEQERFSGAGSMRRASTCSGTAGCACWWASSPGTTSSRSTAPCTAPSSSEGPTRSSTSSRRTSTSCSRSAAR